MRPFWVTFKTKASACIEAKSEDEARTLGAELRGDEVTRAQILPYPALPRLGVQSDCPSFCHSPRQCAGRTSCPQNYACSE